MRWQYKQDALCNVRQDIPVFFGRGLSKPSRSEEQPWKSFKTKDKVILETFSSSRVPCDGPEHPKCIVKHT